MPTRRQTSNHSLTHHPPWHHPPWHHPPWHHPPWHHPPPCSALSLRHHAPRARFNSAAERSPSSDFHQERRPGGPFTRLGGGGQKRGGAELNVHGALMWRGVQSPPPLLDHPGQPNDCWLIATARSALLINHRKGRGGLAFYGIKNHWGNTGLAKG